MNKIRSHETYIRIIPCLNYYYSNQDLSFNKKDFLVSFPSIFGPRQYCLAIKLYPNRILSYKKINGYKICKINKIEQNCICTTSVLEKFDRLDEIRQSSRTFAYKLNKNKFQIQFLKKKKNK